MWLLRLRLEESQGQLSLAFFFLFLVSERFFVTPPMKTYLGLILSRPGVPRV